MRLICNNILVSTSKSTLSAYRICVMFTLSKAYTSINRPKSAHFGLGFHQRPYVVYMSSAGSKETDVHIFNKYKHFMNRRMSRIQIDMYRNATISVYRVSHNTRTRARMHARIFSAR